MLRICGTLQCNSSRVCGASRRMFLKTFQVINYKCYHEPEGIDFSPGLNIITGQNNVGKTAFLESLGLTFSDMPHRSLTTIPLFGTPPNPTSGVTLSVTLSQKEVYEALVGHSK